MQIKINNNIIFLFVKKIKNLILYFMENFNIYIFLFSKKAFH